MCWLENKVTKTRFWYPLNLHLAAVGNIDTSGISMLDEVKKIMDRRGLKVGFFFFSFIYSAYILKDSQGYWLDFPVERSASISKSRGWGDEETEQVEIPGNNRPGMDLSDSGGGCWSMQLHASQLQTKNDFWWISIATMCELATIIRSARRQFFYLQNNVTK